MGNHTIRLLAVGNSFSDDAFFYLHDLAAADGVDLTAVNLYIGGCPLSDHWKNACSNEKVYLYMENGVSTERYVSIHETLSEGNWDYIMTQQASHDSGLEETYEPYLGLLKTFFQRHCPEAVLLLHETWAYELDSDHGAFPRYQCDQEEMFRRLRQCYHHAAQTHHLQLIPTGEVIQRVRKESPFRYHLGERSLCRDGYHLDFVYGRYLAAAVVYSALTGRDIRTNSFSPPGSAPEVMDLLRAFIAEYLDPREDS